MSCGSNGDCSVQLQQRNMTLAFMQSQQNEIIILVINSNNSATLADKSAACEHSWRVRLRAFEISLCVRSEHDATPVNSIRGALIARQVALTVRQHRGARACTTRFLPSTGARRSLALPVRPHRRSNMTWQQTIAQPQATIVDRVAKQRLTAVVTQVTDGACFKLSSCSKLE
jgi:hypothetical protein